MRQDVVCVCVVWEVCEFIKEIEIESESELGLVAITIVLSVWPKVIIVGGVKSRVRVLVIDL